VASLSSAIALVSPNRIVGLQLATEAAANSARDDFSILNGSCEQGSRKRGRTDELQSQPQHQRLAVFTCWWLIPIRSKLPALLVDSPHPQDYSRVTAPYSAAREVDELQSVPAQTRFTGSVASQEARTAGST